MLIEEAEKTFTKEILEPITENKPVSNKVEAPKVEDRNKKLKKLTEKDLFLENVKNLTKHYSGNTLKIILRTLEEIGYNVYYKVLVASHYGVPQARERIYIIGFRKDLEITNFTFPKPSYKEIYLKDILFLYLKLFLI